MNIVPVSTPAGPQFPIGSFADCEWVCKTNMYAESIGGVRKWLKDVEETGCDLIYLYDIKALSQKCIPSSNSIVDDIDWDKVEPEIIYYIRWSHTKEYRERMNEKFKSCV